MTMPGQLRVFYGGTFDPVHNGHLAIARCARDVLATDVRLMPAADPPHRAPPGAGVAHRATMLDLAVTGEPGLLVDRRELERSSPSWTIDTLREVRAGLGDATPVALLVGADSMRDLPQWKDWRDLFTLAHFVVAERRGSPLDANLPAALEGVVAGRWADAPDDLRAAPAGRILRLRQPLQAGSATELRQRIARGRAWRHLVPDSVAAYIDRHRLYADGDAGSGPL